MKKLLTFPFLLPTVLCLTSCDNPEPPVIKPKWNVRVCNSIGCQDWYCASYEHKENSDTYCLYDSNHQLTNQITISAGYIVKVGLSKNE